MTASTNRDERFAPGSRLWTGDRVLRVESARPHQGRWLVHFEGVDDRTSAERLRGLVLTAEPLGALPDDERWVHELIDSEVLDRAGTRLGVVVAVEANPAHDLLVLDDGTLVPLVFVVEERPGIVVVDPPAGLLDVNRGAGSE